MYKRCDFSATQMYFVHGAPLHWICSYRILFSVNKKSRLEKANSYTQKHKHKYWNFQLAVRVISLTYTSRKWDKVIFGTVILPSTPPLSASFVCQVSKVAWHSLCMSIFSLSTIPVTGQQLQEGAQGCGGRWKILSWGEGWRQPKTWATCAKSESQNFHVSPNANTACTMTWRLKVSTRVTNTRAKTDVWPFTLKGQMKYSSLIEKDNWE